MHTDNDSLTIMMRCRLCAGKGQIVVPHCQLCGAKLDTDDEWWDSSESVLPCGHDEANLVEMVTCPECEGNGRYPQTLTPQQSKVYLRRKKIRGGFVATLVFLLTLSLVVVVWREPQYICGGWLMSIMSLLLVTTLV